MNPVQPFRLNEGGRIQRDRRLHFTFDGTPLTGFEGDTLASALLANGVRVMGRGLKFHRPRGVLSAGAEEPNAMVRVGRGALAEPSVRATLQPLYDGLYSEPQNCWPSVNFDMARVFDFAHGLFPAGFYNKTFMWPHWHWFEASIRRMAGLGRLPPGADPDTYEYRNAHCDVLVCGAGAAGLAAAHAAAERGARVMLAEQDREPGGGLLWLPHQLEGEAGDEWAARKWRELTRRDNVTVLNNATVSGCFDHNLAVIVERVRDRRAPPHQDGPRERLWKVRARNIIFATGAIEQSLVFPNNDRPGIMLAGAVHQYLSRYAVAAGRRVVIAANNDSAHALALALQEQGIEVAALVDSRGADAAPEGMKFPVLVNSHIAGTRGGKGVTRVSVEDGNGARRVYQCDCVAMSGGWQPAVHLFSQARGKLRYSPELCAFVPDGFAPGMAVVGAANGTFDADAAVAEGYDAGDRAAGAPASVQRAPRAAGGFRVAPTAVAGSADRQWVDFQHDVTLQDIDLAVDENFTSVEHMKRYTTAGMALDQGKTGNINALAALAARTGRTPGTVGTTTFRPFYLPVTLGALAGHRHGDLYAPVQHTAIYECHKRLGAGFQDYGSWRRPEAYPRKGESLHDSVRREVLSARRNVVLFDGSPLGKIEVRGPDAAEFLHRIYVNNIKTLVSGRARYGLMLNENGVIMDDGIVACLEENLYLVHASSSGAAHVFNWLEAWLSGDWPNLDVLLTPVTSQWANIAVSGPRARDLVQRLECNIDFTNSAFPHMSIHAGTLMGVPARILRASFTGELGFEINVPADYGASLWEYLLDAGRDLGIEPLGVEALMVLRAEKGFIHVGGDTDGTTTPVDLGWDKVIEKKPGDFIGRRSLSRPGNRDADRLQLVGIRALDDGHAIVAGAHVLHANNRAAPAPTQGFVTTAVWSPVLNRWVGLGLVRGGHRRMGEQVNLFDAGHITPALITGVCAYDRGGERLHG